MADEAPDGPFALQPSDLYCVRGNAAAACCQDSFAQEIIILDDTKTQSSAFWSVGDVDLSQSFAIEAGITFDPSYLRTEGIALLLQNDGRSALGEDFDGLGFEGITNSLPLLTFTYTPGGMFPDILMELPFASQDTRLPPMFGSHNVRFEYNEPTGTVTVDFDGMQALTATANLPSELGNDRAMWGFTTANADLCADTQVEPGNLYLEYLADDAPPGAPPVGDPPVATEGPPSATRPPPGEDPPVAPPEDPPSDQDPRPPGATRPPPVDEDPVAPDDPPPPPTTEDPPRAPPDEDPPVATDPPPRPPPEVAPPPGEDPPVASDPPPPPPGDPPAEMEEPTPFTEDFNSDEANALWSFQVNQFGYHADHKEQMQGRKRSTTFGNIDQGGTTGGIRIRLKDAAAMERGEVGAGFQRVMALREIADAAISIDVMTAMDASFIPAVGRVKVVFDGVVHDVVTCSGTECNQRYQTIVVPIGEVLAGQHTLLLGSSLWYYTEGDGTRRFDTFFDNVIIDEAPRS